MRRCSSAFASFRPGAAKQQEWTLESMSPQQAAAAANLRALLEEKEGSSLRAWLRYFDRNNDRRTTKHEMYGALDQLECQEEVLALFEILDGDKSGELTLDEIDPSQADLWNRFIEWSVKNFGSAADMVYGLNDSPDVEEVTEATFCSGMPRLGWNGGNEALLFSALDINRNGSITAEELRWLDLEVRRLKRKREARMRALSENAWRDRQKKKARALTHDFRDHLLKKHGCYLRAWRVALSPNDAMSLNKNQFMKACAKMGWHTNSPLIWRTLDNDSSATVTLEKLDLRTAEFMAKFHNFVMEQFGSAAELFTAIDVTKCKNLRMAEFSRGLDAVGWKTNHRELFQGFDRDDSKSITEDDLVFLNRWRPHAMLLAKPNPQAMKDFKALLLNKFGTYLKAWRQQLDKDSSNRCNFTEFQMACERLRFSGDVVGAWRALDTDLSGYITLGEIDEACNECLLGFKLWADLEFGSAKRCFQVFDQDASNSLSMTEFCRSMRIYGYPFRPVRLFRNLDADVEKGTLSMYEIGFLDDWELEDDHRREARRPSTQRPETRPDREFLQIQLKRDQRQFQWQQQQQQQQQQTQQQPQFPLLRSRSSRKSARAESVVSVDDETGGARTVMRESRIRSIARANMCSVPPSLDLLERPRAEPPKPGGTMEMIPQLFAKPFPQLDSCSGLFRPLQKNHTCLTEVHHQTIARPPPTPRLRAKSPYARPLSARRTVPATWGYSGGWVDV